MYVCDVRCIMRRKEGEREQTQMKMLICCSFVVKIGGWFGGMKSDMIMMSVMEYFWEFVDVFCLLNILMCCNLQNLCLFFYNIVILWKQIVLTNFLSLRWSSFIKDKLYHEGMALIHRFIFFFIITSVIRFYQMETNFRAI